MKQTIEIEVPDSYEAKWNNDIQKIELIRKDNLPTTWDEYKDITHTKPSYYTDALKGQPSKSSFTGIYNEFQSKEIAEAFIALGKLIQLRDEWWRQLNWKPNWGNYEKKYIIFCTNNITTDYNITANRILAFPTEEVRDKFLDCFKDLIEIAKPLL